MKRFIRFHDKRHPRDMGVQEAQQFLTHLAVDGCVAASTQSQALSAILFLYQQVLKQDIGWIEEVVRAKQPHRVPVVLTQDEVAAEAVVWLCSDAASFVTGHAMAGGWRVCGTVES